MTVADAAQGEVGRDDRQKQERWVVVVHHSSSRAGVWSSASEPWESGRGTEQPWGMATPALLRPGHRVGPACKGDRTRSSQSPYETDRPQEGCWEGGPAEHAGLTLVAPRSWMRDRVNDKPMLWLRHLGG